MAKKKEKETAKTEKKINKTKKKDVGEKLKVIPIGGADGIGMNMTLLEHGEDLIAVDCGVAFPEDDMPGVDLVIPDFTYILRNSDNFRGLILTHGHEDHIGAVPYLLKQINVPVYGTPLTLGILRLKLAEHGIKNPDLREVFPGETIISAMRLTWNS